MSIDRKDLALFTAALSLESRLALSIAANVIAFCNVDCCLLFKFCSCMPAYLSASALAIGIPDSYIAWVIAAEAILDAPNPL